MLLRRFFSFGLLAAILSTFPANGYLHAAMEVWKGWDSFGLVGEPEPKVFMPSCDALEIVAEDAIGFVYYKLGPRARQATHVGWEWRVDEGPEPTFLGRKRQDRPLAIHFFFEIEGEDGAYSEWRLQMFGFPEKAHTLTYVWGSANPPGSVLVNPYHKRGRLVVLRNGYGEYGVWQEERIDLRADFAKLFVQTEEDPAYLVVSTDVDDSDSRAVAGIRGLFFEDDTGERFSLCDS